MSNMSKYAALHLVAKASKKKKDSIEIGNLTPEMRRELDKLKARGIGTGEGPLPKWWRKGRKEGFGKVTPEMRRKLKKMQAAS